MVSLQTSVLPGVQDIQPWKFDNHTHMQLDQSIRAKAWASIVAHWKARTYGRVGMNEGSVPRDGLCSMYEFGVFTGGGMRFWQRRAAESGSSMARLPSCLTNASLFGFDSFEGQPVHDDSHVAARLLPR